MLRTILPLAMLLLIISSAAALPAYSLVGESGPLNAYSKTALPNLKDADVINIHGFSVDKNSVRPDFGGFIDLGDFQYNGNPSRTLVYGSGNVAGLSGNAHVIGLGGGGQSQPFLGVAVSDSPLPSNLGFSYSADSPLQFDQLQLPQDTYAVNMTGRLSGSSIIGSDVVSNKYSINGSGVKVAIVDTGTDFGNPDLMHSLARDENGIPIMLDADGQGVVLARATYIAKIDEVTGKMLDAGYTPKSELPENITSWVYLNDTGAVYMRVSHGEIPVYNTLYPFFGPPVLNATATVDWKIGENSKDYIRSQSGIYRFGVIYQTQLHFGTITFALVPVLVVDSEEAGVYDTIIPDMYSAWYFFASNELPRFGADLEHLRPAPSFDFTDDTPIKIGDGNEFLVYDYDKDGFSDFSAGTVGARVVDVWQVISNKTEPLLAEETGYGGVVVADLLEPFHPSGEYFGVMYDLQGHGTSTAGTVASLGRQQYDIYDNSTQYPLAGIAPGAEIIPIKSLWAGDSLYAWLYAAGYDLNSTDGRWNYTGQHKADIISNSWGIAPFPLLQYGPGYDIMSVLSSLLAVPGLLSDEYPGTVMVNSMGNNGLGYGSVGSPNSAPLAISVGATSNNVHIGYNGFANVTRFGNSAAPFDEISDFSSRGPGLFGDPKPELMAIGSYAFTPTIVNLKNLQTTPDDSNQDAAFALFGGTSMAAPMAAGVAALVIEEMKAQDRTVDPFEVKSILMSSAKDLKNDPFVQGSGRVDGVAAIELTKGKGRAVTAYTEDTVENVLSVMADAIYAYNDTLGIIVGAQDISDKLNEVKFRESRWFAGYIEQGMEASTEITVENPTSNEIKVELSSVVEKLIARHEIKNSTRPFEKDPVHNGTEFGYIPNYYNLQEIGGIPDKADLMVARVNFPFTSFMNLTEFYGDHLRLASVYAYDWVDDNSDGNVSYTETSMVNRGGSWGTVQELRVADPKDKFQNTPLIGIYPVPQIFSFWQGDRQINSTAMNYTLTVEFYSRQANPAIKLHDSILPREKAIVTVAPHAKADVKATIETSEDALPGVYYGSIIVKPENSNHHMVMPVSYVITSNPVPKDVPVVFTPDGSTDQTQLGLRPNGYVGGLFDMTSRYAAGEWRSYYFTIDDSSITSMSLKISWPHNATSINAMAFGPEGRVIASSVPAGVFETFAGWPTNDWLGTTAFSEGGAFYFSQNSGENSTILIVPVNQTGIYSVLLHNTLFHGETLYEPIQVEAKFSTILPDIRAPVISVKLPKIIGITPENIPVTILEENPASWTYAIDAQGPVSPETKFGKNSGNTGLFDILVDGSGLDEGMHRLRVDSWDLVGHSTSFVSAFEVDRTPPAVQIVALTGNTTSQEVVDKVVISKDTVLSWNVTDKNGVLAPVIVSIPNASKINSVAWSSASINSTALKDGTYEFSIFAQDIPGNSATRNVAIVVDRIGPTVALSVAGGTEAKGSSRIILDAQDANLQKATLLVDEKRSIDVTGMTEYELDTSTLADGKHVLTLLAIDAAGNENSASVELATSNVAPQLIWAALIGLGAGGGIASAVWFALVRRRRALQDRSINLK